MTLAVAPPSGATVVIFPQDRNIGKARHVARVLATKETRRAQQAYWDQAVRGLQLSLLRAGVSWAEIERQVTRFHTAVADELSRRAAAARRD